MGSPFGALSIHCLAAINNFDNIEAMRLLVRTHPAHANVQMLPDGQMWKAIYRFARTAVWIGSTNSVLLEFAWWEGSTPLHAAAGRGRSEYTALLLAAKGDPTIRNRLQQTPLDLAHARFGGDPPSRLREVLGGVGSV